MHTTKLVAALAVLLLTAGCGGGGDDRDEEPEEAPMKVEETVFGDLVGTQDKARDRSNAAVEQHREALESRVEADEGAPPEE
ncbi:MAG TPA: hypothetical protein VD701_03405 [Steroidobacteraceae bacterium]|nr:hypothetical protein [Steroidobacteraceae bacterium]